MTRAKSDSQKTNLEHIINSHRQANELVRTVDTYRALLNILGQIAFDTALAINQKKDGDLEPLQEAMQLFIGARKDDREAQKTALTREQWQFDATAMCLKKLSELQQITGNPEGSETDKLTRAREVLFGELPP
jgi:hypothetical protein